MWTGRTFPRDLGLEQGLQRRKSLTNRENGEGIAGGEIVGQRCRGRGLPICLWVYRLGSTLAVGSDCPEAMWFPWALISSLMDWTYVLALSLSQGRFEPSQIKNFIRGGK